MFSILLLLLTLTCRWSTAAPPEHQELPASLPCRFGVVGLRPVSLSPDTVAVHSLFPGGPAERAGLQPGDRIIAIDAYRIRTPNDLSRWIQSRPPESEITLTLLRRQEHLEVVCTVTDLYHLYFLMGEQGGSPGEYRATAGSDPVGDIALELIAANRLDREYRALQTAFEDELNRYPADCRLSVIQQALTQPLQASQVASEIASDFADEIDMATYLEAVALRLGLSPELPKSSGEIPLEQLDPDRPEFSRQILSPLLAAARQTATAFAPLAPEECRELWNGIPSLLARFGSDIYLEEGDREETAAHVRALRLAKRVELDRLFAAAIPLSRLLDQPHLTRLRRIADRLPPFTGELPPTLGGDFRYARRTPAGWVLVGDTGPNYYGAEILLVVDLGGDDTYVDASTVPPPPAADEPWLPVSLIVDFSGDDFYQNAELEVRGGVRMGLGLLIDLEGDDLYAGGELVQGAAFCGIGLLWDRRGNDRYLAGSAVQGAAFFGGGLLIDEQGDDLYSAGQIAQGFGGPRGFGLLVDRRGDDRYLADHQVPSSYGEIDVYRGLAQGVGCGFRGFASGGIGLLADLSGNDIYQAGNFAQGTGYFFGMGVLADAAGDDIYRGSRYAQGSAAHQAAGILLDRSGDDTYRAKIAASQGAAWDAAVGVLKDEKGDDDYRGRDLAQGAASMNGIGLLYDARGRDRYRSLSGQGWGGGVAFWGGRKARNLGLLIDTGGHRDSYDREGRGDDSSAAGPDFGLFIDR